MTCIADAMIDRAIDRAPEGCDTVGPSAGPSLHDVVAWVSAAAGDQPDAVLIAVDALIAWADAQRLRAITLLRDAGRSPAEHLAHSNHGSTGDLSRSERRADAAAAAPAFATALSCGVIAPAHLDRLADTLRRLTPEQRASLLADEHRLLLAASHATPNQFARLLRREEARLGRTSDQDRLEQQKASVRLTSHTDADTGMVIYRLALDPLNAVALHQLVDRHVESLFHRQPPPGCPTDPLERQAHLRALAVLSLLGTTRTDADGDNAPPAPAEVIVVVDHTTPDDEPPDIDWGLPVDIPDRVLTDLLANPATRVHEIVVRNGTIITAPGNLDLGRTTRLANRAQRRALRALYRGCAIQGCDATYDQCTIHHLHWWRDGGCTDLHNLLPLCSRHHHLVHDAGWQLTLGPHRALTITTPTGATMTTGPPHRWAA